MRLLWSLACLAACTFDAPKAGVDADRSDGGGSDSGGGVWTMVEELTVPVRGETVMSTFVLQAGVRYRLRASGTCYVALGVEGDAEYFNFPNTLMDIAVNIDVGLAVNDSSLDIMRTPRWGAYTETHVYEVEWMGDGAPIVAQFHDGNTSNNGGELKLAILALQ